MIHLRHFLLLMAVPAAAQTPLYLARPDTSLFAAVVQGIPAVNVWAELPIVLDPGAAAAGLLGTTNIGNLSVDSILLRARSATLKRFGVATATDIGQRGCPGYMLPDSAHVLCPDTRSTRVAIGNQRSVAGGSVPIPLGEPPYVQPNPVQPEASAVVRLVFAYLTPHGSAMLEADYYLTKSETGWEVVARRPLVISH